MPKDVYRPTAVANASVALTDAQKQQFVRDGYLILRQLYSLAEVTRIRDVFMAQAQDGPVDGLSDRIVGPTSDPLVAYPRMMNPHLHLELPVGAVAREFLLDARLKPILTDLLGEEPLCVQTMFYFKPAGARGQELHQDNFYLRVAPGTCMAAWLAVDDADIENGGMKVVPGSHTEDIACPQQADTTVSFTTEYVPVPANMEAMHVDLKSGDVLFFNGSLIHGSSPNTSTTRFRRSLIAHYVPHGSEELAHLYKAMTFDGECVEIAPAEGGGPCGTAQGPMAPH